MDESRNRDRTVPPMGGEAGPPIEGLHDLGGPPPLATSGDPDTLTESRRDHEAAEKAGAWAHADAERALAAERRARMRFWDAAAETVELVGRLITAEIEGGTRRG